MILVAPRIVNDVPYVTRIKHEIHFAWQAQYLVKLECDFSWQVQHLVTSDCRRIVVESSFYWRKQFTEFPLKS